MDVLINHPEAGRPCMVPFKGLLMSIMEIDPDQLRTGSVVPECNRIHSSSSILILIGQAIRSRILQDHRSVVTEQALKLC
jgi:hypothetical protein